WTGHVALRVETLHAELHLAARGHRIAGVEHEVRDHLFDLAAVDAHTAAGHHGGRELDIVAQEPRDQSFELLDHFSEVEDLRQEHLVAAESKELARESSGSVRGTNDLQRVRAAWSVRVEAGHEKLAVTADRGQQIVEVVRDTAGEPSNRLELLRVQELLLQKALIGDVPVVDDDDPLAVLAPPPTERLDGTPVA